MIPKVEDTELGSSCHEILQLDSDEPPQRVKRLTSVKRANSSLENGDSARYLYCPSHAGKIFVDSSESDLKYIVGFKKNISFVCFFRSDFKIFL